MIWVDNLFDLYFISVRWCCVNEREYAKCTAWSQSVITLNLTTSSLTCIAGLDKFDCYRKVFNDEADLMTADSGEIYTAGKYYNLVPIANELYSPIFNGIRKKWKLARIESVSFLVFELTSGPTADTYYSVAVVHAGSKLNLNNLQGARSCHSSVGSSSGWNQPISQLLRDRRLNIIDCNNHVKSAALLFGGMCAPDALNRQFNPTGDNPSTVCDLCQGTTGNTYCTNQDPYAGNIGALRCLADRGDIAFIRHTALIEIQTLDPTFPINQFELLCTNGQRASWQQFQQCNWVNRNDWQLTDVQSIIWRASHRHQL